MDGPGISNNLLHHDRSNRGLLGQVHAEREALRVAAPFSTSLLAYATSFIYQNGVLCYTNRHELRTIHLNKRGLVSTSNQTERVVYGRLFAKTISDCQEYDDVWTNYPEPRSMKIQGYAEGVVTLLCDFGLALGQYLFAIDLERAEPEKNCAIEDVSGDLFCLRLQSTHKLFVRHNAQYLYYGIHTATGSSGFNEWLIYGYNWRRKERVFQLPLQLYEFVGSDIGTTACFTIYNDSFIALTNQMSFESEEVDWTSLYHYVQISLGDSKPEPKIKVMWRRQHHEGPIHDAWTDLGFQVDQRTGELLIVECRKEWLGGTSTSERTYYTQSFTRSSHREKSNEISYPTDDPLTRLLDDCSKPQWEKPKQRIAKYVHPEYDSKMRRDRKEERVNTNKERKEYIRAKTKFNGYSFNVGCFVDMVVEDIQVDCQWRQKEILKLRVVSRIPTSPFIFQPSNPDEDSNDGLESKAGGWNMLRPRLKEDSPAGSVCDDASDLDRERYIPDSEEAYGPSEVYIWPNSETKGTPQSLLALNNLLCPRGRAGNVIASLQPEGIVYMAGPTTNDGLRALIYISFDATFGFEGMRKLDGSLARPRHNREAEKKRLGAEDAQHEPCCHSKKMKGLGEVLPEHASTAAQSTLSNQGNDRPSSQKKSLNYIYETQAEYLKLRYGFWLR